MSHEAQTDLRIRRTHHFLQEAMIELITEKGGLAEHAAND